ncbi:hypothetical protein FLA_3774 [Filimonas lacunae]|nr:hypothetical protein FLA_3774 [Filimonas lacunae]
MGLIVLLAVAGSAMAFSRKAASPVYVYLEDLETGSCTIPDTNRLYTPVARDTPGSMPIRGNLGNFDGKGRCDTIFVLTKRP